MAHNILQAIVFVVFSANTELTLRYSVILIYYINQILIKALSIML